MVQLVTSKPSAVGFSHSHHAQQVENDYVVGTQNSTLRSTRERDYLNSSRNKKVRQAPQKEGGDVAFLLCDPGWCVHMSYRNVKSDVQNKLDDNTRTRTHTQTLAAFVRPCRNEQRNYPTQAAESKRLKRLEKNRESARECRRRKKKLKENLEAQLATLEVSESCAVTAAALYEYECG